MKRKKRRHRLDGPIHARITALRKAKHMTQAELAAAINVHETAVSHWENRIARPDMSRLAAVADVLGVSIEELIDGEQAA